MAQYRYHYAFCNCGNSLEWRHKNMPPDNEVCRTCYARIPARCFGCDLWTLPDQLYKCYQCTNSYCDRELMFVTQDATENQQLICEMCHKSNNHDCESHDSDWQEAIKHNANMTEEEYR